jgi:hypothetical protein
MLKIALYTLALGICLSCSTPTTLQNLQQWHLVYQNDFNGKGIYGSRPDLINALKLGSPIRVAWGEKLADGSTCIEFAQPDFVTLNSDTALVVQFPMSFIQTHYVDPQKSFLKTNPPISWRALMRTDGHYHQFHYNLQGEITRIMYARTNMSWYVQGIQKRRKNANPVLATENTFKLDSIIRK